MCSRGVVTALAVALAALSVADARDFIKIVLGFVRFAFPV
jgi:hypothetical protein